MKKIDELAKIAIEEVAAELNAISEMKNLTTEPQAVHQTADVQGLDSFPSAQIQDVTSEQILPKATFSRENISPEKNFLLNLKERTEVLFEGLNEMPKELVGERLELTLKFLEFVLANVENRLENLPK